MCLLIDHPKATDFTREDIADFYTHNSDGIGVMRVENGEVVVVKTLPKNAEEAWQFYATHAKGRDCALHFRMKTHGLIDMDNCHPYAIPGTSCWLMHNGVLHTGNDKDTTKSDTWHYARDYLAPVLSQSPDILFNRAFQEMIGTHIGQGNRFIIMSPRGHVVINRHHGVDYKGAWLSNTYAWSAVPTLCVPEHTYDFPNMFDDQDDQDDPVDYFFSTLDDAGLWEAYGAIDLPSLDRAIAYVGYDSFYGFCDYILNAGLTDHEVIEFIRSPDTMPIFSSTEVNYDYC